MTVTVAPEMTPPVWSVTAPRIRPKLPWENSVTESSNTHTTAPSTHTPFLAREILDAEFIAPPFRKPQQYLLERTYLKKGLPWKGPPTTLGKGPPGTSTGICTP